MGDPASREHAADRPAVAVGEVVSIESSGHGAGGGPQGTRPGPVRLSNTRLAVAMAVALASDAFSMVTAFAPPAQLVVDGLTAAALFVILGRRWWLLPAFVAEAIPGVAVLPVWSAVVGSVWLTQGRATGPRIAPVDPREVIDRVRGGPGRP